MSAPLLNESQKATFRAMWKAGRSRAAIGLALGLNPVQVRNLRPKLGCASRHARGEVRIHLTMKPEVLAVFNERARSFQMSRQRYLAIVLEREAKAHA